jgi:hypothetical protein
MILMLIACQKAAAAQSTKVLILPFAIHSEQDISFLKEGIWDMLSSRLYQEGKVSTVDKATSQNLLEKTTGPLTESSALSAAKGVGADYVLMGSVTLFGEIISTDAKFIETGTGSAKVSFSESGRQKGDAILHVQALAQQINQAVFGLKEAPTAAPALKTDDIAASRMNPEKLWETESGQSEKSLPSEPAPSKTPEKSGATVLPSPPARSSHKPIAGFRAPDLFQSEDFKLKIRGISFGDLTGDGRPEIVFISQKEIHICRLLEKGLEEIQVIKGKRSDNYISVDAADINQNGKAEIFVTNFLTGDSRLASLVLEYNHGNFQEIASKQPWYYRIIQDTGAGDLLLGQQRSREDEFFSGKVERLIWKKGGYTPAGPLSLPLKPSLYGVAFGDVFNDGRALIMTYTSDSRLLITDQNGTNLYTGSEGCGQGSVELGFSYNASPAAKAKDTYYIPQRISVVDVDNDRMREVALVKNKDAAGGLLKRTRLYKSGQIQILSWKGGQFRKVFETAETAGHISDYAVIDMDGDGRSELLYALVKSGDIIPSKERSCIVLQSL